MQVLYANWLCHSCVNAATRYRGDAKQWLMELREEEVAEGLGVVSVGGDGLLSEIVDVSHKSSFESLFSSVVVYGARG